MGQTLKKLGPAGSEEKKDRDIGPIIEKCYETYFAKADQEWTSAEFFHAICQTVEEINKKIGSTQFRVPSTATLQQAFDINHKGKGKLKKEEFQKILQDVILETGVTGLGVKDIILYLFGVPVTALFIKQQIFPKAIPNEVFIPGVTSATVFGLAKFNKI
ncbi:hypothetical protein RJ639_011036 [Escallonia herrerae]|uniref:Uncharacterized protein n=1 Tax=Escallonia herrerae TaxID=1293975 RepID=A0AA89AMP4_9ASTE|nr:hypothetical protein RJ639_011036 [Escallonia herrerae]